MYNKSKPMTKKSNYTAGFSFIEVMLILVVIVVIGAVGYWIYKSHHTSISSNNNVSSSKTTTAALSPPAIPNGHAYLGIFDNPLHITESSKSSTSNIPGSNVIQQLPTFNKLIGKSVSILHFYMPFNTPLPTSTMSAIKANGSIPLISWGCASVTDISSGKYDSFLNSYASSLKSYGGPVFLRWYWEFNQINSSGTQPAGNKCGGYNNGSAFITAWQHIYNIFHSDGVTNVAFVWCPGYSGGNFNSYYPGDAYVNWIGLDRYERTKGGQPLLNFSDMFSSYYNEWASHNKPIMIAETAAMGSTDQSQYLNDVLSGAPQFPNIKAFVYFDATGPAGDWQLEGKGVGAFQQLANSSYFSE